MIGGRYQSGWSGPWGNGHYKPFHCPCPKWRPAESRVLYDYYKKKLESGEFFHNPGATCASRPHIALKPISGEPKKGGIFDIRPCGKKFWMSRMAPP